MIEEQSLEESVPPEDSVHVEENFSLEFQQSISGQENSNSIKFDGTILVADDQAINLEVIKQHLERLDFVGTKHFAVNGQECIDSAIEIFDRELQKVQPK